MQPMVRIPCVIGLSTLVGEKYPLVLVDTAPQKTKLVWAAEDQLVLREQIPTANELLALLVAPVVREDEGSVVVSVQSREGEIELTVSKAVLSPEA